ncbi:MAG: hypothetical protein ABI921_11735 [Panacibacter sp.]
MIRFKKAICVVVTGIALMLIVLSHDANAQTKTKKNATLNRTMNLSTEEAIAKKLFQSLKTNDEALWQQLYPTNEEYKDILQLMLKENMSGLTQQKIDEMMGQRKAEAEGAYKSDFEMYHKQADSIGINWSTAVFQKFDFLPYLSTNFSRKYLNGDIWCTYKKNEFVIEGVEAVETPAGFKLQSIKGIRKIEDSY